MPARANIAALKALGVRAVLAFSAVGSLREDIRPGDVVLPAQIIDRTKGVRPASFFEGTGVVAHAAFGDPFAARLVRWLEGRVRAVLAEEAARVQRETGRPDAGPRVHADKCVVCMEGPQFSTRAESQMYRAWGGDIINMSVLPEAKLAREAELRCVSRSSLRPFSPPLCVCVHRAPRADASGPATRSSRPRRTTTRGARTRMR